MNLYENVLQNYIFLIVDATLASANVFVSERIF